MKSAKKWIAGWRGFVKRRHRGRKIVTGKDITDLQLDYIRKIQKNAAK